MFNFFLIVKWGVISDFNFQILNSIQKNISFVGNNQQNFSVLDTLTITEGNRKRTTFSQRQTADTIFKEIKKISNDTLYFHQNMFFLSKASDYSIISLTLKIMVWIVIALILFTVFFIINFSLFNYLHEFIIEERKIYEKLKDLYERCNATITKEASLQSAATINIPFGFIQRNVKAYPIANSKEIEYELLNAKDYNKFKYYKKKFVIVFDELDKVEPTIGKGYYYDEQHLNNMSLLKNPTQ